MIDWIAGLAAQTSAIVGVEASRYATPEGRAMIGLVFDIAVKGLLIVSAAGLAAYLLRGASSAVRHFVWTLAAAALVALPVFALAMPRWQVAVPGVRGVPSPASVPEAMPLRDVHVPERRRVIVVPGHETGSTVIIGGHDIVVEVPRVVIKHPIAPMPPLPPMPPIPPVPATPPIPPTPPTPPGVIRVDPERAMVVPQAWSLSTDAVRRAREQAAVAQEAAREAREASYDAAWEARRAVREAAWEARAAARKAVREARQATRELTVHPRARHQSESGHDDSATTAVVAEARTGPSSPSFAERASPASPFAALDRQRRPRSAAFPLGLLGDGVPWTWLLVAMWLTGVVVVLSRVVLGATRVHVLGSRAWCIERGWPVPLLRRLCAELGIERHVKLLEGESTAMPLTWGVLNPVVLLPSSAAEWPAGRLETVLRHELAHVRRLDVLTQLIAEIACALHWFNPLVWMMAKRLRVERELACDDDVLTSGSAPAEYAADLVALARSLRPAPAAYAAIAMARPAYLQDRVHALLDDERRRGRVRLAHALAASGAALLIVAPLAAMVPVPASNIRAAPAAVAAVPEDRIDAVPSATASVSVRSSDEDAALDAGEPTIVIPPLASIPTPVIEALSISRRLSERATALSISVRQNDGRQETLCWGRNDDTRRTSVNRNDESYSLDWEADGCEVQVRIRGEVRFNSDFTAVEWISPGGSMRLVEEAGSTERRIDIGPGPEGIEYTWRVDGREAPFDAAASDWLSEMLLQLFRSAGYAASERSIWFLREHGVPGLLQEIDQLRSDHTRRAYYQVALERGDLDASAAARLIERAATQIRSDHELSRLLLAAGERFDFNDALRDAFLAASRTLESDHERRRVLTAVLTRGTLDAVTTAALLASVAEMGSDHEKSQVLTSLGARYALEPALRSDYLSAAATIGSDHEKRRVLDALIAQGSLNADELAALLDVASTIRSDHEASRILVAIASADLAEPALGHAFLTAAATIDSDHEHRRVLSSVLNAGRLPPDVLSMVLHSALEIRSDHNAAEVLLTVLRTQQLDAELRTEFLRVLDTIESSHDHGRVSSALLRAAEGG